MENDIWIYHIVPFLFGFHLEFYLISKGSVAVATGNVKKINDWSVRLNVWSLSCIETYLVKEIEAKKRGTIINKQHFHLYLPWII